MTEMNPNNGNETILDNFSQMIFKSDNNFNWSQNAKVFQELS